MIIAGLKLTLLGMAVVFFFLLLLIGFVKMSYRFLSAGSARELAAEEAAEMNRRRRATVQKDDGVLIAVISAAIAAHRSRTRPAR